MKNWGVLKFNTTLEVVVVQPMIRMSMSMLTLPTPPRRPGASATTLTATTSSSSSSLQSLLDYDFFDLPRLCWRSSVIICCFGNRGLGAKGRNKKWYGMVGIAICSLWILLWHNYNYNINDFDNTSSSSSVAERNNNDGAIKDTSECCGVMCTTPSNVCCLPCTYLSSPREHDLLMAMMEGLTVHLMEKHSPISTTSSPSSASEIVAASTNNQHNAWLQTRAWEGNSHIGNRPEQATYYYDWMRSVDGMNSGAVRHVCEIGMNGGHSALIFLAALSKTTVTTDISRSSSSSRMGQRRQRQDGHDGSDDVNVNKEEKENSDGNTAKLTMFDRFEFDYSQSAMSYIEKLYPGRVELHKGDSTITVPEWTLAMEKSGATEVEEINKCDVFSVDGDHSYEGARMDILNAARATKKGGKIILDDMYPDGPTRRAFENVLLLGRAAKTGVVEEEVEQVVLTDPMCVEDVYIRVGYEDRINGTNAREMYLSWCSATVV